MSRRAAAALLVPLVVGLGLGSRRVLPGFTEAGDALYATLIYLLSVMAFPKLKPWGCAAIALGFSCAIEVSQLAHPAWLDGLRATVPGRLVLGTTFVWADFPCYFVGAALGLAVELAFRGRRVGGSA